MNPVDLMTPATLPAVDSTAQDSTAIEDLAAAEEAEEGECLCHGRGS